MDLTSGEGHWLASVVHLDLPTWTLDLLTTAAFIALFTARSARYHTNSDTTSAYVLRGFRRLNIEAKNIFDVIIRWSKQFDIGIEPPDRPNLFSRSKKFLPGAFIVYRLAIVFVVISIGVGLIHPWLAWIALGGVGIVLLALFLFGVYGALEAASTVVIPVTIFLSIYVHVDIAGAVIVAFICGIMYFSLVDRLMKNHLLAIAANSERAMLVLIGLLAINYLALHSHSIQAFIEKATQWPTANSIPGV